MAHRERRCAGAQIAPAQRTASGPSWCTAPWLPRYTWSTFLTAEQHKPLKLPSRWLAGWGAVVIGLGR